MCDGIRLRRDDGCALGIKSPGLLLVGYAGLAVLMSVPCPAFPATRQARAQFVMTSALGLMPAFVIAYAGHDSGMAVGGAVAAQVSADCCSSAISSTTSLLFGKVYERRRCHALRADLSRSACRSDAQRPFSRWR